MVYVLNSNGQPLMPTNRHGKVRRLLNNGLAKVVKSCPFTIQLKYESTTHTQPTTLGVDAGYKHIGVCASSNDKVLYQSEVILRTDIVELLKTRRDMRRARRNRKTRYRAPRFLNRVKSKHKGWLAPSTEQKINTHIRVMSDVCKLLPVSKIRIETAEFDIHKIKNPSVSGVDYQYGEKYGHYNTRNYCLWRDNHKCRNCGKTHKYLYVVPSNSEDTISPADNYTVCKDCLEAHTKGIKKLSFAKKYHFAPPTEMGIMRDTLMQRARDTFAIPVEQTYGYITKGLRNDYNIEKSHINDAYCIAGNLSATPLDEYFYQKKVRCHNRQIHKFTIGKGGYRKLNQAPYIVKGFRLFDKVKYNGIECFIYGRRTSGSFDIRLLDGTKVHAGISYKKLKLVQPRQTLLIERREAVPPTT